MAKFKVFPYRLHTSGGHVLQVYSEINSPNEILEYLQDKEIVDIFWTTSVTANTFVPVIMYAKWVIMISPIFGRSGLTVEKDSTGNLNLVTAKSDDKEEFSRPIVGSVAKKRN